MDADRPPGGSEGPDEAVSRPSDEAGDPPPEGPPDGHADGEADGGEGDRGATESAELLAMLNVAETTDGAILPAVEGTDVQALDPAATGEGPETAIAVDADPVEGVVASVGTPTQTDPAIVGAASATVAADRAAVNPSTTTDATANATPDRVAGAAGAPVSAPVEATVAANGQDQAPPDPTAGSASGSGEATADAGAEGQGGGDRPDGEAAALPESAVRPVRTEGGATPSTSPSIRLDGGPTAVTGDARVDASTGSGSPTSPEGALDASVDGNDPVWRQVRRAVGSLRLNQAGEQQLTVRLNPAELGSVTIRVTAGEQGTTIGLVADSAQGLARLQAQRSLLTSELRLNGLDVAVDVSAGDAFGGRSDGGRPAPEAGLHGDAGNRSAAGDGRTAGDDLFGGPGDGPSPGQHPGRLIIDRFAPLDLRRASRASLVDLDL